MILFSPKENGGLRATRLVNIAPSNFHAERSSEIQIMNHSALASSMDANDVAPHGVSAPLGLSASHGVG